MEMTIKAEVARVKKTEKEGYTIYLFFLKAKKGFIFVSHIAKPSNDSLLNIKEAIFKDIDVISRDGRLFISCKTIEILKASVQQDEEDIPF